MRPIRFALCLAALAWCGAPALAGDELPPTSQFFDEYDTNADGKVTADEFRGSSEVFKLLDKNGDGAVCPDELGLPADYKPTRRAKRPEAGGDAPAPGTEPRRGDRMEQLMKRLMAMDADKDGRVSKAEWQGPEQAFERLDRNKDGFLDAQDRPEGGPDAGPGRDRKDGPDAKRGRDAPTPEQVTERAKEHFATLDKNKDGKLDADEVPMPKLLEMADTDKDGAVSLEEFVAGALRRLREGGKDARGKDARGKDARGKKGGEGRKGDGGRLSGGMLRRFDADKDGKVSREEFPGRDDLFARLDADKDGFLTEADIQAARAKRDARSEGAPEGKGPAATPRGGNVIEQQDKDGDGKLNRAEFQGSNELWRLLDRNGDGWITADELR